MRREEGERGKLSLLLFGADVIEAIILRLTSLAESQISRKVTKRLL
jgi:hypothetical protein